MAKKFLFLAAAILLLYFKPVAYAEACEHDSSLVLAELQALVDAERFFEAESFSNTAISCFPKVAELHTLKGFSLRKQGRYLDSIEVYSKAVSLKPDYVQAKSYLALSFLHIGQAIKAKVLAREVEKTHPDLSKAIASEAKRLKIRW